MYAMILAAGRGERMRPLTDHLPKPLVCVDGKPLIVYHLEKLSAMGITNVVINLAWLGQKLIQQLGDGSRWGLSIDYIDEGESALETAGGIKNALTRLQGDVFMVINGDIWTDFDFDQLPRSLPHGILSHLVMVDNPEHNSAGDFAIDEGLLSTQGTNKLTFAGIGVYHRHLFDDVKPGASPLGPVLRHAMAGLTITGQHHRGRWTDVGTPQRLAQLEQSIVHCALKS